MLVLNQTTDKVQVVLDGAVTTNQLHCYSAFRDITTSAYTPGKVRTITNNTTDVDIVTSPGASTQRVVDYLSVFNADTIAATVTIKFDDNGTEGTLWKGSLNPDYKVEYVEGSGFRVLDASGVVVSVGTPGADGANGAPGLGNSGTAVLDFGAYPGQSDASVVITGQAGILTTSVVEAWLILADSADHSADEHFMEELAVAAGDIVAGTGFTIYGKHLEQMGFYDHDARFARDRRVGGVGINRASRKQTEPGIFGQWNVQWRWS